VAMTTDSDVREYGTLVGGQWMRTGRTIEIRNPYDDALVAVVHRAGPEEIEAAITNAQDAFQVTRHMPSWQRAEILERISAGITDRREEFARAMALEAGKPIKSARIEADRASFVFKIAAEEAKRNYGEIVPLDWLPGNERRTAEIRRVPLGVVAGITPFNYPLNLVAHKVAPALAAGDPILIRPASQTPVSALLLGEVVLDAGWPQGGFAVLPSSTQDAAPLVEDERIRALTFTGSPVVGWGLKQRAGRKRVTLELGGNAGVIVHHDADIAYAAERITWGGFSYAGQSCISVQRVFVHEEVYEEFLAAFTERVRALRVGDPLDEATDVGPVINRGEAERVATWVEEAREDGAETVLGGNHDGTLWEPTVLVGVKATMRVANHEVFAPLVGVTPYSDIHAAIRAVDAGDFGLQAGIFTNDLRVIEEAFDQIEVGGLMVNDVSTYRIDHMPYGGVKNSGFGREGLRYAIEEMTEMKLLTFNHRN
jgi:acyl-CoA reductase-like NAD-dependent aldehyde dehydrogenase